MSCFFLLFDCLYQNFGELLTVTVFTTIAFAAFFLENDNLLTLHEWLKHFTIHFYPFNGRSSDFNVAVGIKKKNLVKGNCVACLNVFAEMMDIKEFSLFSFKLLSFDFYNSVHANKKIDSQLDPLGGRIQFLLFYKPWRNYRMQN